MTTTFDTIVVGAGFSGLVAARNLSAKGRRVLVLEARDRDGGRAKSYTGGGHAPVDLGCSWIHGFAEGTPVQQLVEELGIETAVPKPAPSKTYGPNGVLDSALAAKIAANFGEAMAALRTTAEGADAEETLADELFATDSKLFVGLEVEEKELAEGLARTLQVPVGAVLEHASLKWWGWEDNFDGTNAAPIGGYQTVTSALRAQAEASGAIFKLSSPVSSISLSSSSAVSVESSSGTYTASTAIVTIPLAVLKTLPSSFFSPPLPAKKIAAIKRTNVGTLGKLCLTYPTVWWDSEVGSMTLLPEAEGTQKADSKDARGLLRSTSLVVASFASDSLPNASPTLLTYLNAGIAKAIEALPVGQVAEAMHDLLVERLSPSSPPPKPSDAALTNWSNDPFTLGATTTPSTVGGGRSPLDFVELGKSTWGGRLGFAGEHTDPNHRGSVTGATESGVRESARVEGFLSRQSD